MQATGSPSDLLEVNMHSISTAAASHVKIGTVNYPVICWTVESGGKPTAWFINRVGVLTRFDNTNDGWELRPGTADA